MRHASLAAIAGALLACATRRARAPRRRGTAAALLPGGVRPLRYALDLEVVPGRGAAIG